MRVIPGDPTITKLGGSIKEVDASTLARSGTSSAWTSRCREQYLDWVSGVVRGDFGSSYFSQFSVTTLIGQRIGATLLLAFMAMVIGLAIAVPASVAGADLAEPVPRRRALRASPRSGSRSRRSCIGIAPDHRLRRRARRAADAGIRLVPARPGREHASRRCCPRSPSAIGVAAVDDADPRPSLVEVGSASFVRTAQGKGLPAAQVVVRHELPNASIPAITQAGIIVAHLVGGAVIVEYVFARPGPRDAARRLGLPARLRGAADARADRCGRVHRHEPGRRHAPRRDRPATAHGGRLVSHGRRRSPCRPRRAAAPRARPARPAAHPGGRDRGRVVLLLVIGTVGGAARRAVLAQRESTSTSSSRRPRANHLFGTDELGRDLFTRVLYGGRTTLLVAFAATVIAMSHRRRLGVRGRAPRGLARRDAHAHRRHADGRARHPPRARARGRVRRLHA